MIAPRDGTSAPTWLPGSILFAHSDLTEAEENASDFDAVFFLDLCAAIEAAVIHEHLNSIGIADETGADSVIAASHPMTSPLISCGVLVVHDFDSQKILQALRQSRAYEIVTVAFEPLNLPDEDLEAELELFGHAAGTAVFASRFVLGEDLLGLSYSPTTHAAPLYLALSYKRAEQRASQSLHATLAAEYSDFRNVLLETRQDIEGPDFVRIPPIALEVLGECRSLNELPDAILQAHDRYEQLRNDFTELDEILMSSDVSLKEKLKAKAKILHGVSYLNKKLGTDRGLAATSMAIDLNDAIKIEGLIDGLNVDDISWGKLVPKLAKAADAVYWRFRLRPMFATRRHYLEASPEDFSSVTRRLFGHKLSASDVTLIEQYGEFVARRCAAFARAPVE